MPVKSSGTLSFDTDIVGEFKGTKPHSLSEYYAGGTLVPAGTKNASGGTVPSSGTIKFSDFYGAAAAVIPDHMEVLIVGGGGGGGVAVGDPRGQRAGGGGGGGGVQYAAAFPYVKASRSPISVTVGAGGVQEANGGNSSIVYIGASYIATGGGKGGVYQHGPAGDGGSGGGGAYTAREGSSNLATYANFTKHGNTGGPLQDPWQGGGGGAGAPGGGPGSSGHGGEGFASSITGSNYVYASGGGGGTQVGHGLPGGARAGGAGGTGAGEGGSNSPTKPGQNGTNYGAGGGGNYNGTVGGGVGASVSGNGANGVVIFAYPGGAAAFSGGTVDTTSRPGYVIHKFDAVGSFTLTPI